MGDPEATQVFPVGEHASPVAWSVADGALATAELIVYHLEVTTGGASGTAEITVTSDTPGVPRCTVA